MHRFALCLLVLGSLCAAQEAVYYKFEAGGGRKVINYSAHTGLAPAEGTFNNLPIGELWAPGKFGSCRKGATTRGRNVLVDTGWAPQFQGSFAVAFFLRTRLPYSTSNQVDLVTGGGQQERFTVWSGGGGAQKGLGLIGIGQAGPLWGRGDVYTPSLTRWVHVAFVADATTRLATFYLDGVPEAPMPMSATPRMWRQENNLLVGGKSNAGSHDIDEFRFLLSAPTAQQIKQWATQNPAADGAYGKGCFPRGRSTLLASNRDRAGRPVVGNNKYALEIFGPANSAYSLGLGTGRTRLAGRIPLPLDLGFLSPALAGCFWEADVNLGIIPGVLNPGGASTVPAPIPNLPALIGAVVYCQALLFNAAINDYMTTNAFAVAIGQ